LELNSSRWTCGSKKIKICSTKLRNVSGIYAVLGILITFGEAVAYVMSGMYGDPSQIGFLNCVMIIT
jgi:protein transport protein SEC61 subunit alpha